MQGRFDAADLTAACVVAAFALPLLLVALFL
jgi:hypothetical protein